MGSNCQPIIAAQELDNHISKMPTSFSRPGSKTTLQYINPIIIEDDDNF